MKKGRQDRIAETLTQIHLWVLKNEINGSKKTFRKYTTEHLWTQIKF